MRLQQAGSLCDLRPGQPVGQRQVKAELLHHEGIAPAIEQLALAQAQPFGAAPGDLVSRQGGAQRVQSLDDRSRQGAQRGGIAVGHQRKKAIKVRQPQPWQLDRRQLGAQVGHGTVQRGQIDAIRQTEGRLDGAVKAVFAWITGDRRRVQPQIGRHHGLTADRIPAQPCACAVPEFPGRRGIIHGIPFHLFHGVALAVDCHTVVTGRCHSADPRQRLQDRTT